MLEFLQSVSGALTPIFNLPIRGGQPFRTQARLGEFVFSLDTGAFQSLTRNSSYDWQGQRRIGRQEAQQYVGQGEEVIELSGSIFPSFRGGIGQIGFLRAMAQRGTPVPFFYGFDRAGQYAGLWVIKDVKETRTVFMPDGTPRQIDFSVTLKNYGEDYIVPTMNIGSQADLARPIPNIGFSNVAARIATSILGQDVANVAGSITGVLATINSLPSTIDSLSSVGTITAAAGAMGELIGNAVTMISGQVPAIGASISEVAPFAPTGAITPLTGITRTLGGLQTSLGGIGYVEPNLASIRSAAQRASAATSAAATPLAEGLAAAERTNGVLNRTISENNSPQSASMLAALNDSTANVRTIATSMQQVNKGSNAMLGKVVL